MADVSITRLGNVVPGDITKNQFIEHTIDFQPFVLGSARGEPTVLYLERDIKIPIGHGTISINRIETDKSLKNKIKNAFDGYPIKFTGTALTKAQENKLDFVVEGTPTTADLDGDGEQEFVFATQQGNIEVYDSHKKRFTFKLSTGSPKVSYFDFRRRGLHIAHVGGKDVVFMVLLREFYGEIDAKRKSELAKELGTYVIVKIDQNGIVPLSLQGLPPDASYVQGIAAINKSGSNAIDEIVTLLELKQTAEHEAGLWLYRHRLDGSAIAAPRKTYGEERLPNDVKYTFAPGSDTLVGKGEGYLYFIHPGKDVNWVRAVPAANLIGATITDILAVVKHQDRLLAMVSEDKALYLLDEEGRFYTAAEGGYQANRKKVALTNLKPPSPQHTLKTIKGSGDSTSVLAIYFREQQAMPMKDEEIIEAAEKYLQPDVYQRAKESSRYIFIFDDVTVDEAKQYCLAQKIRCPDVNSMDELRAKLPGLYQKFVEKSEQELVNDLRWRLFEPLSWKKEPENALNNKRDFEESVIVEKEVFYRWVNAHHLPGEIVLQSFDIEGRDHGMQITRDYDLLGDGEAHPSIAFSNGRWSVVYALQKMHSYLARESGFYLINW